MTEHQWRCIDEMFARALELPEALRGAFVIASCGADPEVRAQVLSLLASDAGARECVQQIIEHAVEEP